MNKYITKSDDLQTTNEAKRAGFLEIALRKSKEAIPYVDEAKSLKAQAESHNNVMDLAKDSRIKIPLSEAAGISTKANTYLSDSDIDKIIIEFIKIYLEPAGNKFSEELTYRYLLSKGDALGGRMRNIIGNIACEKLTRYLTAQLRIIGTPYHCLVKDNEDWISGERLQTDLLSSVRSLRWITQKGERELRFNLTVPIVKKNIDITLFSKQTNSNLSKTAQRAFYEDFKNYLALGELKGGIDPAGADEHWKTGNTALERIRTAFSEKKHPISTFFIGAAIESSMANEIYNQCRSKKLSNAANLTDERQLIDICKWLTEL